MALHGSSTAVHPYGALCSTVGSNVDWSTHSSIQGLSKETLRPIERIRHASSILYYRPTSLLGTHTHTPNTHTPCPPTQTPSLLPNPNRYPPPSSLTPTYNPQPFLMMEIEGNKMLLSRFIGEHFVFRALTTWSTETHQASDTYVLPHVTKFRVIRS